MDDAKMIHFLLSVATLSVLAVMSGLLAYAVISVFEAAWDDVVKLKRKVSKQ